VGRALLGVRDRAAAVSLIVDIGRVLGIPGVVILCWYLLEVRKGERQKATDAAEAERQRGNDKRNAALERMRIEAENRRTEAMSKGFEKLGELITDHSRADLDSHAEQNERISRIEGVLEIKRRTPVGGVPIREINRARTGGDR
jgi:hypothetical protein